MSKGKQMNRKDWIRIGKRTTSEAMKNSYLIKPYVKPAHYAKAKTAVSALNFLFRYLDKAD